MTDKDFLQTALKSYDNPQCISVDEFRSDLERFAYIRKILIRHKENNEILNDRLILNHLVICFNLFGTSALDLALHKIDKSLWPYLLPYLYFLDRIPEEFVIEGIPLSMIKQEESVIEFLQLL